MLDDIWMYFIVAPAKLQLFFELCKYQLLYLQINGLSHHRVCLSVAQNEYLVFAEDFLAIGDWRWAIGVLDKELLSILVDVADYICSKAISFVWRNDIAINGGIMNLIIRN